jgi:hypothetical protein
MSRLEKVVGVSAQEGALGGHGVPAGPVGTAGPTSGFHGTAHVGEGRSFPRMDSASNHVVPLLGLTSRGSSRGPGDLLLGHRASTTGSLKRPGSTAEGSARPEATSTSRPGCVCGPT